jgi:hypothetical protein
MSDDACSPGTVGLWQSGSKRGVDGSGVAAWVNHVIWWQVYPLGFVGAEGESVNRVAEPHRLRRLEGWLDHLISLGCNGCF